MTLPRLLEPEVMDSDAVAEAYETMDHLAPNAAVVGRLAELGAHGSMLDLGCGPAHIPLAVCERFPSATVVGVDMSPKMLAIAHRHIVTSPYRSRIVLQLADAKRLPFSNHCFDVVYSNTTLHHLADPVPFLREAWRVLKPGGVLLIRDLYRPPTRQRLDELVATYAAGNTPLQRQLLSDSLHAALTPQELHEAAVTSGMTHVAVSLDTDRHMTLHNLQQLHRVVELFPSLFQAPRVAQ